MTDHTRSRSPEIQSTTPALRGSRSADPDSSGKTVRCKPASDKSSDSLLLSLNTLTEQGSSSRNQTGGMAELVAGISQTLDSVGEGISIVDMNDAIVYVNAAHVAMFGYKESELIGQPISILVTEDSAPIDEQHLQTSPQQRWGGEVIRRRKNGESFPVHMTVTYLRNSEGDVIGRIAVLRDVTEEKESRDALESAHSELEQRINEADRHSLENEALAEIGRIVSSSLDVEAFYQQFAEQVRRTIPFDRISVSLRRPDGLFEVSYLAGDDYFSERNVGNVYDIAEAPDYFLEALSERKAVLVSSDNPDTIPDKLIASMLALRSLLAVPLVSQDELIGILYIRAKEVNAFNQRQAMFAERVASQIAGALANSVLHSQLRTIARERAVLAEIGRILSSSLHLGEVYEPFEEQVRLLLPFDRLSISSLDPSQEDVQIWYASGLQIPGRDTNDRVRLEGSLAGEAVKTGESIVLQGLSRDDLEHQMPRLLPTYDHGVRSFLATPLIHNNQTVGILQIRSREEDRYKPEDAELVERVGAQIAGAIYNAQLHAQLEQEAREREVLAEIGRIVSSSLDIGHVYGLFTEQLRKLIPFDQVVLSHIDVDRGMCTTTYVDGVQVPGRMSGGRYPFEGSLTAEVVGRRRAVRLSASDLDYMKKRLPVTVPLLKVGLRSFLSAPLLANDEVVGALHFASYSSDAYSDRDVELVGRIAYQIAGAFANATLYQELLETQLALEESERQYELMADHVADVIWVRDMDTRLRYISPSIERQCGFTAQEAMEMSLEDAIAPSSLEDFRSALSEEITLESNSTIDSGRIRTMEMEMVHKDGSTIWAEVNMSFLRDADGHPTGILGVTRDVTGRRQLEEQLRQSQKMEAVGQLAGGIAHDFNNLLTPIIGYAEMGETIVPPNSPLREYLEGIRMPAERASDLVRQLLTFSRRQVVEPKVVDLSSLVADMERILRRLISEDIELVIESSTNTAPARVDPGQIELAIMNLTINARDAMPEGGRLVVGTRTVEIPEGRYRQTEVEAGRYVILSVSDTGTGMSEEVKRRIFEPFYTTKEPGKGTGLGLSTVFGIVSQTRGRILVDSAPGRGTTFEILIPVVDSPVAASDSPVAQLDTTELSGAGTILLVEDEPIVRDMTAYVLKHHGYSVIEASNGKEALTIVESQPDLELDMMITDFVMPQMGGRELAGEIRAVHPDLVVLYTSGYSDDQSPARSRSSLDGMFIQKPFTPTALIRKVKEILD